MMKKTQWIIVWLSLGLASCMGVSLDVAEDNTFDSTIHTKYAWKESSIEPLGSEKTTLTVLDSIFRSEADSRFEEKGYQLVDPTKAEFFVSYQIYTDVVPENVIPDKKVIAANKRWVTTISFGDGSDAEPAASIIEQANVRLVLSDKAETIIWQASAAKAISNRYADQTHYKGVVKRVLARMFTHLPSKS